MLRLGPLRLQRIGFVLLAVVIVILYHEWATPNSSWAFSSLSSWDRANSSSLHVKTDHPRLFASRHDWAILPARISNDPYLASWNATIFERAHSDFLKPVIKYPANGQIDGGAVLDVARELQGRVKRWAYAYMLTSNQSWIDRTTLDLWAASGNNFEEFRAQGVEWNTEHWLCVGEFLTTFALAFDWLYDSWTIEQRKWIRNAIVELGLSKAEIAFRSNAWFLNVNGNWNCVTTAGIILGSLAVYNEDETGLAKRMLQLAVESAGGNCANAVMDEDGTWSETPDYWYFGTQAHAQMTAALLTSTNSTHSLLSNKGWANTGYAHIYNHGPKGKFNYGDCGPPKLTATANSLLLYAREFQDPILSLYQRDQEDAADPLSIFWYEQPAKKNWFEHIPLDRNFASSDSAWVSLRSSWDDLNALFVAMKAGRLTGHQNHNHLDHGDFVLDALGERWAVQLCHNNYLSPGYFVGETASSDRWLYYRCRTEGQNVVLMDRSNQDMATESTTHFASNGDMNDPARQRRNTSTNRADAFWITNITEPHNVAGMKRGVRLFDNRHQVLIQDEIPHFHDHVPRQWRMHTAASIVIVEHGRTASLFQNNKSLSVTILAPSTCSFRVIDARRSEADPPLPAGGEDDRNEGISVLVIDIPRGQHTVAVVFTPRWNSAYSQLQHQSPEIEQMDSWTL